MLPLGKTIFGTSRSYCLINYYVMTFSGKHLLSYENLVTYHAMLTLGFTVYGTGLLYSLIDHFYVTGSLNHFLFLSNNTACRAMSTFLKTVFGTGRSYSRISYYIVTERSNVFLSYDDRITYRTLLAFSLTLIGTSRSNSFNSNLSVRKSFTLEHLSTHLSALATRIIVCCRCATGCLRCKESFVGNLVSKIVFTSEQRLTRRQREHHRH